MKQVKLAPQKIKYPQKSALLGLSYCFNETVGFDIKASFTRRPVSYLIKAGDITK